MGSCALLNPLKTQFFQKQTPEKKETGGKGTKEIKEKKNEIGVTIICLFSFNSLFCKKIH